MDLEFEWDAVKAEANHRKHGVSFDEAESAFYDRNAKPHYDVLHSDEEDRRRLIGVSNRSRALMVVYVLRGAATIRIISARKATVRERHAYGKED